MPILIHNLSYQIPNTSVEFKNLTLAFEKCKTGIVGDNGVGKTTLLRLITGDLLPNSGSVQAINAQLSYCPQKYLLDPSSSVAQSLAIEAKLQALLRIQNGSLDETDYAILGHDWDLEIQARQILDRLDLGAVNLDTKFSTLSGGQKTKLMLAKTFLSHADFIILDEPTNNLDLTAKQDLYQFIQNSKQGFIIVSHDRDLLNLMDQIIEISSKGLKTYGGNYDFYCTQKSLEQASLVNQLEDAEKYLRKSQLSSQKSREKHAQRQAQGKKLRKTGSQAKLLLDKMKQDSENMQAKLSIRAQRMIEEAQEKVKTARESLEIKQEITADLSATLVPNSKMVLEIKNLCFAYPNSRKIFENFNLSIFGSKRLALLGKNGSGKTTLLKLIQGQLQPNSGTIKLGIEYFSYLAQELNFLDQELNLVDNFLKINPAAKPNDAYAALAMFKFRNTEAEKLVCNLSGGEKIRAGLAISLISPHPPQLIILDEPTNHLDLASIQAIEAALLAYQGAILVISHDQKFLDQIGVSDYIHL